MKKRILYSIMFIAIISCRKDRLKNEKDILIGKWEWIYSDQTYFGRTTTYNKATPLTENTTYQMVFLKKGIIEFYENNVFIEKYRIKFNLWDNSCRDNSNYFNISLDNSELVFHGCISRDTLKTLSYFPFDDSDGTWSSINYFIRK
jgi:hypothetical protein